MVVLNVKKLLKDQGRSKTWLCNQMDISFTNLSKAMNCETTSISFKYIDGFCKALNCTFDELFAYVDDNSKDEKGA